jgi:hypothetical protein
MSTSDQVSSIIIASNISWLYPLTVDSFCLAIDLTVLKLEILINIILFINITLVLLWVFLVAGFFRIS